MATSIHSRIWGATTVLTVALSVTGTAKKTASFCTVTNGWAGLWCWASVFFATAPTLDARIRIHTSPDGTTWDASDQPIFAMNVARSSAASRVKSFPLSPVPPYLRMDARVASTTQQASVSIRVKPWKWQSV